MKKIKTNVMRILDSKKIEYNTYTYPTDGAIDGVSAANYINKSPSQVFKTLVTVSKSKQYYVFMLPADKELDLKKAAKAVNEKSMELIPSKDLLPLTGYIHGGCSPIGMKKIFPTVINISAKSFDTINFSGGKIGFQIEMNPSEISKVIRVSFHDICL